eukprot:366482-Chlamydomonas_euryale.AAC.3
MDVRMEDQDSSAPRGRLMIREMVLENFKSYAGEQRVGPFDKVRAGAHELACAGRGPWGRSRRRGGAAERGGTGGRGR